MKLPKLILLSFLFMGLGTIAVFDPFGWKDKQEENKEKSEKVFWFKDKKIQTLTFKVNGLAKPIQLDCQKSGGCDFDGQGEWRMSSPVEAEGDPINIGSFLSAFKNVSAVERTEILNESELSQFGLAEPEKEVKIQFLGSEAPVVVKYGQKSAIGANAYLYSSTEPKKLYLVAGYFNELLKREPLHWRNKRIFPKTTPEQVVEFSLSYNGKERFSALKKDNVWRLQSPISVRANDGMIGGLLNNILYLNAQNILAESHNIGVEKILRGLKPMMEMRFKLQDGKATKVAFYKKTIGKPGGAVEFVALSDGVAWVGTVDSSPIGRYDRPLLEYRDRHLLGFAVKEKIQAQHFFFPREKKEVLLELAAGQWKVSKGALPTALSTQRVQSFFDSLEVVEAKEVLKNDSAWQGAKADLEWEGRSADGKAVRKLRFVLSGRDKVRVNADLPDELFVFSGEFLRTLPVRLLDLDTSQNKQVVTSPNKTGQDKFNQGFHGEAEGEGADEHVH